MMKSSVPKPLKNRPLESAPITRRVPSRREVKHFRSRRMSLLLAGGTIKKV